MKLEKIERIFDRILDMGAVLAAAMILFSMLAVCASITARKLFDYNIPWVIDVIGIILLYATFLSSAWLLRTEGHVKLEMVVNRLNPKHRSFLKIVTFVFCAVVFAVFSWYGIKFTLYFFQTNYYMSTTLEAPYFLVLLIIPIGSLLLFIEALRKVRFYQKSRSSLLHKGSHEPTTET